MSLELDYIVGIGSLCLLLLGPVPASVALAAVLDANLFRLGLAHLVLVVGFVWVALQSFIALVLGASHLFAFVPLHIAECLLLLIGLSLSRPWLQAIRQPPGLVPRLPTGATRTYSLVVVSAVALSAVDLVWRSMSSATSNYDTLMYHLPTMLNWYQTGSFTPLAERAGTQVGAYPYTWEALCALFLFPFGDAFAAQIPNFLAWTFLGLTTYRVGVTFGAAVFPSVCTAALVLSLPVVRYHAAALQIDLAFGAMFAFAVYSLVLLRRDPSAGYCTLFVVALAVLVGIKTSAVPYGALLAVAGAAVLATGRKRSAVASSIAERGAASAVAIGGIVASAVFVGGFWYVRNYLSIGNPLGYVELRIGDLVIFDGTVTSAYLSRTTLASVFHMGSASDWKILADAVRAQLSIGGFALGVMAITAVATMFMSRRNSVRPGTAALAVLFLATAGLYVVTPFSGDVGLSNWRISPWTAQAMRYALPAVGVLGFLAAQGATHFSIKPLALVMVCVVALSDAMHDHASMFAGVMVTLLASSALAARMGRIRPTRSLVVTLAVGMVIVLLVVCARARTERAVDLVQSYGGIVGEIDRRVGSGERIGYLLSDSSALFYGSRLDKRVVYVLPETTDREEWTKMLRDSGIRHVVVGPLSRQQRDLPVLEWLNEAGGAFHRISKQSNDNPVLYYVR